MSTVVYDRPSVDKPSERNAAAIRKRMLSVIVACRPASLLEIGAGEGRLGFEIAQRGIRYVGIEPVECQFQAATQNYPSLKIVRGSCYDDPAELRLGTFDLVYSNDVIEHLYEPRKLVSFSKAHLNPGGLILCCTPHYGSYFRNLLLSLANRWDHHHAALWDGGHIKFFSKKTLHQIFAEGGFTDFQWGSIRSSKVPVTPISLYCVARLQG